MSEMLKVTTPMLNKNQPINPKAPVDPTNPFSINDPARVVRTHNITDLSNQQNGLTEKNEGPVLLMSLLKDPAVAVSYLKNIFLLEEIFKLLPANNQTVTEEIEQIFKELMMEAPDIKDEFIRQQNASTAFKGELFDFLRDVLNADDLKPSTKQGIATLLRSINNLTAKDDILDAAANSLSFMKENLNSSKDLNARITELILKFRSQDAQKNFSSLKEDALNICQDVESSILYTPQLSKVVSILKYNLSRYNDNVTFFNQSASRLRQMIPPEIQKKYISLIENFAKQLRNGEFPQQSTEKTVPKVMDSLINLVNIQSENENMNMSEGAKIDNILHSLLSSPCNFTPLLHFIVPVFYENVKAFAEVWINPQSDEKDMINGAKSGQHFLLVIDIENIGRFEAEIFSHDRTIDFHLYCPEGYENEFAEVTQEIGKTLKNLNYNLGSTRVEKLREPRSLMQVFKSLPYKRVGVDVKI